MMKAGISFTMLMKTRLFDINLLLTSAPIISYHDKMAYGQSKLANILHANELSRRLQVTSILRFHSIRVLSF